VLKNFVSPFIFGFGGVLILIALGSWQIQRLSWKQNILSEIELTTTATPRELPGNESKEKNQYMPVVTNGKILNSEIHVLISIKYKGPGYRVISAFDLGTRKVLLDQGFIPLNAKGNLSKSWQADVIGNLYWPDEIDSFTPKPDFTKGIWFARDVAEIAKKLGTDPVMIVAKSISPQRPEVIILPITPERIPNNHFQYAVTWFSLALVWAGMTLYLVWRIRYTKKKLRD
jgi:surfeit locus 1 family protein